MTLHVSRRFDPELYNRVNNNRCNRVIQLKRILCNLISTSETQTENWHVYCLLCLGFVMSRVCRVWGLLCLGFVMSIVGLIRFCLSRVGYGTNLISTKVRHKLKNYPRPGHQQRLREPKWSKTDQVRKILEAFWNLFWPKRKNTSIIKHIP